MNEPEDRSLDRRIENLPRAIRPERDLWAGIATRIAEKNAPPWSLRHWSAKRRWMMGAGIATTLAAAAAVVVIGGRATTTSSELAAVAPAQTVPVIAAGDGLPSSGSEPRGATREGAKSREAERRAAASREAYGVAMRLLQGSLDENRRYLSPSSSARLDRSLTALDAAIDATARALDRDPDNVELVGWLIEAYQQKIDTLAAVVDLVARTS